jgi:GAF domain-containing protein
MTDESTEDWVTVVVGLADTLSPDYDVVDAMDLLVEACTRHTGSVDAGVLLADESRSIRAAHTFPLTIRGQTIGALNLFMNRKGGLSHHDVSITRALTRLATVAILQQRSVTAHATLAEQLRSALDSRIVIEQAKGLLSYRHDVGMDQAFRRLREHARRNNSKLADVAQRVVDREVII